MDNCICDDTTQTHDVECVMCHNYKNILMADIERAEKCKVHHRKTIMMCGKYEFVCPECKTLGWYSTAGFGGPTQHVNSLTGERRSVNMNKSNNVKF